MYILRSLKNFGNTDVHVTSAFQVQQFDVIFIGIEDIRFCKLGCT